MKKPFLAIVAAGWVGAAVTYGCSSDDVTNPPAVTPDDAGGGGTDAPSNPPDSGGGPMDAGTDTSTPGVGPVTFMIPAGGGAVDVPLASGNKINFAFPASAGGTTVTLTPTNAASIGWGTQFTDVVKMEPAGTTFTTPVIVKPSSNDPIMLDFGTKTTKGPGEGLEYSAAANGFKLFHFSTLAVVPAGVTCSTGSNGSGWNAPVANASDCSAYAPATSKITFGCKAYDYCLAITASCCVDPASGATACKMGDKGLVTSFIPIDSQPYCAGIFTDAGVTCGTGGARFCNSTDDGGTCSCLRDCTGGVYRMDCNGTTCACSIQGGDAGPSFAQGTTCAAQYNMHIADSNKCGYP